MKKRTSGQKRRGFQFLLYGPPGAGKTTLASQLPRPVAIINVEGGADWLYHDLEGVEIWDFEPGEDMAKSVESFLKVAAKGKNYSSIVIDTISTFRHAHVDQLAGGDLIEIGHYGQTAQWARRMLSMMKQANVITCWIASMAEVQDGPYRLVRPGGLSDTIIDHFYRLVDTMIFMGKAVNEEGEEIRYCTITPEGVVSRIKPSMLAKDRTGLIDFAIEFPPLDDEGNPPPMAGLLLKEVYKELKIKFKPIPKTKIKAKTKAKK
jgi:phage nucleotide-binding protein